ncbi:uncharacterized protein LOC124409720 isoform X1 [Diprion similis]|uniref:uncharacterized protein LOC124409720 isoform X1 n=2 Tax=Diprion similis TaxID=362088 RepID=UPI001EF81180|nr:uncharacterized protein LOC124409720 isoform X1 [Diprion similis]
MSTDLVCMSPAISEIEQGKLKAELLNLRRRGAKNASGEELIQGRCCARCKTPLGRIYNTGASCPRCRHRVCRQCREYRGSNGTDWLCLVCHKIIEIKSVSGEWMNETSGARRSNGDIRASPADILQHSIRRSWTINGPPASWWSAVRGSPELRPYQSLPRHRDHFEPGTSDLVITARGEPGKAEEEEQERDKETGVKSKETSGDNSDFQTPEGTERGESLADGGDEATRIAAVAADKPSDGDCETGTTVKVPKSEDSPQTQHHPSPAASQLNRTSQIKPPRIHARLSRLPDVKQTPPKSNERKSNIPILRRSSREFEDIRSPLESVKRSLIPQRYRGSTDDLRRSREDIASPISHIPKLFSPSRSSSKEDRLKRQDSKDEIRHVPKLPSFRKEDRKDSREETTKQQASPKPGKEESKSGIKFFRRDSRELSFDSQKSSKAVNIDEKTEKEATNLADDESASKPGVKKAEDEASPPIIEREEMVESREPTNPKDTQEAESKSERKLDGLVWENLRRLNTNNNDEDDDDDNRDMNKPPDEADHHVDSDPPPETVAGKDDESESSPDCQESTTAEEKENNSSRKMLEEYQVVRRKFSKEEFSNTDDTDEVPNRRSSSHLSPEASPLSTRSSRYSPRESESEPTPALPRKTGESSCASQRVRDAITRTRRESNSSARYESSGSESIRLSSGHLETRKVRFGSGSGIEEVQRDSATSAGEDEPRNISHNPSGQRDSRTTPAALQARAVRRRRQFETQGSRRRGRSHARGCVEDLQHLQVIGRGGAHLSPPQGQPGQDQPIIDYRRLVFISSDSSSGREEDDADSSSGSSSLNGAPRSSLAQGLEDCDWDYFESGGSAQPLHHLQVGLVGVPTLPTTATTLTSAPGYSPGQARNHPGISLSAQQDWSCCPGRGSSACQACGGARGANVFPVPVPIPVPVPYPVPVPASLWTSSLSSTSMINCTPGDLGALQLSRGGGPSAAAQWFAWPPRFVQDVNGGPRIADPSGLLDSRSQDAATAAAVAAATFAFHQGRTGALVDFGQPSTEKPAEPPAGDQEEPASDAVEQKVGESSDSESEGEETKMNYRMNSGSSSGRSSADSSDLEDSASHHFSRVFVVNDDSSTSDNEPEDVEDLEDSDSNRDVGITLRRVTALPEDGPVVLRHVRFLDEDRGEPDTKETESSTVKLRRVRNLDLEKNEIYLVDSEADEAEHRVELKSVRSLDPDVIRDSESPADPDSLMPEGEESLAIVPDSLEITSDAFSPPGGDTCPSDTRADKPEALSLVAGREDDSGSSDRPVFAPSSMIDGGTIMADNKSGKSYSPLNLTLPGSETSTTGSSDTTTGSEVSSDELHEYDITAWSRDQDEQEDEDEAAAFSAVNEDLIKLRERLIAEPKNEDKTNQDGFNSDGFSTDEGGSSRLDSGVATGVEDAAVNSLQTTPGESIESVHAPTVGDEKQEENEKQDEDHTVNDLISIKIHEIFKSVGSPDVASDHTVEIDGGNECRRKIGGEVEGGGGGDGGGGERHELEQVEGAARVGAAGTTAHVSPASAVERRPPVGKDGCQTTAVASLQSSPKSTQHAAAKASRSIGNGNRYKSLVMITQGAYQPVNVVTSDTTTLLQPEEGPPTPRGLAGYYHLALEAAAEATGRNAVSPAAPRRPPTVKRPAPRAAPVEPEVDSGLSVGSASESDDVQSVKSSAAAGRVAALPQKNSAAEPVIVILEEGLADDDSWVEEVSHDEDEPGTTTATEESSEDETNNIGDREEELRGYHRQAIDFTLHTIVEESCEESEAEPSSLAAGSPRKQRPPSASELEKYFFFGLGEGPASVGGSREADSLSETSSIYSEGLESLGQDENGQSTEKNSPEYLVSSSSSRLEKYFLSDFLGFDRDRRDSDGSVGSDSEGRPSPEQRRKRLVRARGTGRSHSSSLDNLLALAQSSNNLSSQNSLQDLSLNPDSQETQSEGSSTETDGADDQTPAFGTDGQFDTVKRKKKKPRNLGTQSPRIPEDRNKTPEPTIELDADFEAGNSEEDRAKTPQPDASQLPEMNRVKSLQAPQLQTEKNDAGLVRGKQHSRDSGFIGSCDDLLQHQRTQLLSADGQTPSGIQDLGKKEDRRGMSATRSEQPVSQANLAPPNASLSRKDSFNNWSSDEETNLMMSKMRQFFKTMVANSNSSQTPTNSSAASPAPSPRLPGSSPRSRPGVGIGVVGSQSRTKPPQLVYFENELTRLMKTVPGIRDEQVKEIVEYLSSEDTWSDSYDSSDYTSSDLEGAGGRRSALQEQISQSCQQIISKFDTTGTVEPPAAPQPQPLGCRDTAFVYQKLVQSFTKMTGDGGSSDASSTPHSSPPLIAKVMHHIGSRLVALMHEVSEGGPAVQQPAQPWRRYPHHRTPSSASTTEDDDSTSDSAQHPLPRSKSHDPLLLLNGHPAAGYQEGEEREASDNERFSWRGSFESALMPADSRTKLSLLACSGDVSASASALAMAAKRRSAGDLLFNPKSLSREQLDRVRSCGSIGGGSASIEDKIWSNRRRSSVPDANTRGESGASAGDDDTEDELEYAADSRATTLPRGLQAAATATNSLPRLPAVSPTSGPGSTMHKAHSVHHFLQQHNNVKSARYRPPGFARNNISGVGPSAGPKRAVSAPGLQLPASSSSVGKRETARSRRQAVSLTPDDGSSLSEACSTPIIGGARASSLSNDDVMDRDLHASLLGTRASSSSLGARSDSMASVYSGAGEGRWCGSVAVRGEVEFGLQYDYKQKAFEVRVTQCRDLAPVDVKRNRSDPYVKVYLLPDKSKGGKRKTKVKKHTLNPVFDETLKFHMNLNGLETRTLWLTVWHSDMFGRNDFLGEVRMALENKIFDDPTPRWYPLQERSEPFDDPVTYKGEVIVGLKFVPPDPTQQQQERSGERSGSSEKIGSKARKSWSKGALHVLVKEARNLQTRAKHGGTCDPFCKSYLLPDKGRSGKQKTGVVRRCTGGSPVWGHTFIYRDVSLQELAERGLELTVWDHDRIASNEFLGGVRFNLGTGKHYGKSVEWMDATGRELSLWQNMLERPNFWVEGAVTLRPNLHNHPRNNAT